MQTESLVNDSASKISETACGGFVWGLGHSVVGIVQRWVVDVGLVS